MQFHFALCCQGHQLYQVIVGSDEVADEVDLGRDNVDHGDIGLAAVADDVVAASAAQHGNSILDSAPLTDKVNHCLGTLPIRDVFDFRNLASINYDCMIGTPASCQFKRLGGAINDDNFCRGQCLEALDTDMAQTTSTDHYRFRPRIQDGNCLLDGMICCQACISQGSNIFRGKTGIQFDDGTRSRLQKVGHAAIGGDAWKGIVGAVHIIARSTRAAKPTGDQRMDDDCITDCNIADCRSNLMHPA